MTDRRYPYAPLARLLVDRVAVTTEQADGGLHGRSGTSSALQADLLGVWPEQVRRWRSTGLTRERAERLAEAAGYLPYEVWPELLDDTIVELEVECAAGDCIERFVPPPTGRGQKRQRYHSPQCQRRWNRRRKYQTDPVAAEIRRERNRRYRAEVKELQARRAS